VITSERRHKLENAFIEEGWNTPQGREYTMEEMTELLWRWKFQMERQGGEFSLLNAIAGSYLSELAYRSKAIVIQTAEQGWKLNHVEYFEGPHTTRCFAAETEDYIIISFRGTASLHNLEHDLETGLYPGPFNSQVHKGWALALNGVFTCLCDYVKESWGRKYRVKYLSLLTRG